MEGIEGKFDIHQPFDRIGIVGFFMAFILVFVRRIEYYGRLYVNVT